MNTQQLMIMFAVFGGTSAAAADDNSGTLDVTAGAGYQYDSNVSLAELDSHTGEADSAVLLELGLDGKLPLNDSVTLQAGYGYTQTAYRESSDFDTAIHRLQGELNWRAGGFNTGLALRHFAARLDGDRFLDLSQVSPSVARLVGKRLYLRAAYTQSDKRYAGREDRDAGNDAFDIDAYWLLDGMQRYLAVGYRVDSEDAADDAYDYDGSRVSATYGYTASEWPLKFRARVQLENRDYLQFDEELNGQRQDARLRASLTTTLPLAGHFQIEGEAAFADYRSNEVTVDYDEMVYSVNLLATF